MLKNLTDKRWQLSEAIDEAEDNLITYQNDYQNDAELIDRINNELSRLQLINGTAKVHGSGIQITVSGNMLASDLIVILNELWAAGAEAVAVNDYRITATTGINYVDAQNKTYLTCDGAIIQDPIKIRAIGNSKILEKSLTMPLPVDIIAAESLFLAARAAFPPIRWHHHIATRYKFLHHQTSLGCIVTSCNFSKCFDSVQFSTSTLPIDSLHISV